MVKHIFLDGIKINSEKDFHNQISEILDFGLFYGANLNALWDMLSSGIGDNIILHWVNSQYSKNSLGDYYQDIIYLFEDVKNFYQDIGEPSSGFNYILE